MAALLQEVPDSLLRRTFYRISKEKTLSWAEWLNAPVGSVVYPRETEQAHVHAGTPTRARVRVLGGVGGMLHGCSDDLFTYFERSRGHRARGRPASLVRGTRDWCRGGLPPRCQAWDARSVCGEC